MTITDHQSSWVMAWWTTLSVISVLNVAAWLILANGLRKSRDLRDRELFSTRGWQTLFSSLFVAGCAFRSFYPRVEALRFCLADSSISIATLGRAVATVAELAFVAQWRVLLREWCREISPFGVRVSHLLLPLIGVAEICSWYTTLTTNFLGSVFEESLWAVNAGAVVIILAVLWLRTGDTRQRYLGTILTLNVMYVLFMCTVDVPMYLRRWRADEAAGRPYLSLRQGWRDAGRRRIVTRRWEDWREEIPWMSLYFSGGVWLSLALMRAPRFDEPPSA
jgi:hypothetical protein